MPSSKYVLETIAGRIQLYRILVIMLSIPQFQPEISSYSLVYHFTITFK